MTPASWHPHLFAAGAFLVPSIYIFNLHKALLLRRPGSMLSSAVFAVAAFAGIVLAYIHGFDRVSSGMAVTLASPLFHSVVFRLLHGAFVSLIGREPRDVVLNWSPGLLPDRLFAFALTLGIFTASAVVVAQFWWGIANA